MKHPTLLIIAVLIPYFLAHIFFTHLIDIHDSYPAKFSSRMILLEEARQNPLIVREHAPNFHRKKFSCQKCVLNVSIRRQKIHNRLNFNAANKSLVANTKVSEKPLLILIYFPVALFIALVHSDDSQKSAISLWTRILHVDQSCLFGVGTKLALQHR